MRLLRSNTPGLGAVSAAGSAPPFVTPLRVASTHNRLPNATGTSSGSDTHCVRWPHVLGQDYNDLLIALPNFFQGATGVSNNGNDFTVVDASIERESDHLVVPILFSGGRSSTVTDGAVNPLSDAIAPSSFGLTKFSRGEQYWVKATLRVAVAGTGIPSTEALSSGTGRQTAWYNSGTMVASSTDAAGPYTKVSGSTVLNTKTSGYQPILLGHPVTDGKSLCVVGTSIDAIVNDSANTSVHGGGLMQRAMHDADGTSNPIPCINMARSSAQTTLYTSSPQWLTYAAYAKYAIVGTGTNDINAGTAVATVQANEASIWASLRAAGITKIIRTYILPRNTSTRKLIPGAQIFNPAGSGYGANTTFDATIVGGTLAGGGSAAVINVTTNGSGVPTTINSITNPGLYTTVPTNPASTTGGTGTGLKFSSNDGVQWGGWDDATSQTYGTHFQSGGRAATLNTFFDTKLGDGTIDIIVPYSSLRDPGDFWKWLSNGTLSYGTLDGVHPSPTFCELGAIEVRTALAALP